MILQFKNKGLFLGIILVFLISFLVFYYSFFFQVWQTNTHWVSDLPVHTQFVIKFSKAGHFPVYSLWYRLVYGFSGFSSNFKYLSYVSMVLLASMVTLKYVTNYWILNQTTETHNKVVTNLVSFGQVFIMPILSYYTSSSMLFHVSNFHVYLGNIAANQWHNSTLILAMPFSILLFYYSVKHLESQKLRPFVIMSLLTTVNILLKPNYSLAYLPVICTSILFFSIPSRDFKNAFLKIVLLAFLPCVTLVFQWYSTFINNTSFDHPTGSIVSLFLVWRAYSPHLLISLLLSIFFPLIILLFYYKKMDRYLGLSWLIFITALLIFCFMAEAPWPFGGNYLWGAICATYILFLFSAKLLLTQPLDYKSKISYGVFIGHFFSGCFLLMAFFLRQKTLIL